MKSAATFLTLDLRSERIRRNEGIKQKRLARSFDREAGMPVVSEFHGCINNNESRRRAGLFCFSSVSVLRSISQFRAMTSRTPSLLGGDVCAFFCDRTLHEKSEEDERDSDDAKKKKLSK